jgi:hypothetical protein
MSRIIISCRDSGESGEWRRCDDDDAAETQTRRVEEGVEGVEDVCRRKRDSGRRWVADRKSARQISDTGQRLVGGLGSLMGS